MRKLSVNTGMSSSGRNTKPTPQAKRVTPPAVPDIYRHSGSSFSSAGYSSSEDGVFLTAPDTPTESMCSSDHVDYSSGIGIKSPVLGGGGGSGSSSAGQQTAFPFSSVREPLTHKVAVYYHQQLALQEDQGIDVTQSPGRDSPGSSSGSAGSGSRHSTASLDSGRASSYLTGGGTSTRSGALSSPRCSVSSCSIGSFDRMSQRSHEHDVIVDWLTELRLDEYANCFSAAGYDLSTITRMTPEDLTAIGIKNPQHRERIKQHIDNLQLPDNLPNYVPGSIEEWLRILRLEDYIQPLLSQGYQSVRDVTQLIWEDLEDIGIVKLGHQKKILLAIKRVKDIISGKWVPPGNVHCQQTTPIHTSNNYQFVQQPHQQHQLHYIQMAGTGGGGLSYVKGNLNLNQLLTNNFAGEQINDQSNTNENDIVLIELRQVRGKSLESLEESNDRKNGTHLTFCRPNNDAIYQRCQNGGGGGVNGIMLGNNQIVEHLPYLQNKITPWRRSYDDGDITPTNEISSCCKEQQKLGGGTLPRHRNSNCGLSFPNVPSIRNRPVAMVHANMILPQPIQHQQYQMAVTDPIQKEQNLKIKYSSPIMVKKQPPEPPRRQSSTSTVEPLTNQFDSLNLNMSQAMVYQQSIYNNQSNNAFNNQPSCFSKFCGHTHQTTVEVHAEKTNDSKSNSSIDSIDILPFANENAGTIKQRVLNRQDMNLTASLSSSSSSSSSSTATIANVVGQQQQLQLQQHKPTSSSSSTTSQQSSPSSSSGSSSTGSKPNLIGSNVLNDIGHMLANLTDELDAMLEEEKRAGLTTNE